MATFAKLGELYKKITDETSVRFEEGAKNLAQISTELQQGIALVRSEVGSTEHRLRQESGVEMDRRIENAIKTSQKDSGAARFMNFMSDPRNKGIEHFSRCRAEDAKG